MAPTYGAVSFYALGDFICQHVGGLFPLFWGRGGDFQELATANFQPFMAMVPVGVSFSMVIYYSEPIMRLKFYCKLNLLPSWAKLVLTSLCPILYCCVVLLKVVLCLLPSCLAAPNVNNAEVDKSCCSECSCLRKFHGFFLKDLLGGREKPIKPAAYLSPLPKSIYAQHRDLIEMISWLIFHT